MLSDSAVHLCEVSWKYLEWYQSYGADTNDESADGWTFSWMDIYVASRQHKRNISGKISYVENYLRSNFCHLNVNFTE